MGRYTGAVTQSILDWYAQTAQAAEQWFTSATPNFWAFTLSNNANDGSTLWVYDTRVRSGAAFPAGTSSPGGGSGAAPGGNQGNTGVIGSWQFETTAANQVGSSGIIILPAPASIVAGNLLLMVISAGGVLADAIIPPDASWILLNSIDGSSTLPALVHFGKIATASEPSTYTVTGGDPTFGMTGQIAQFAGNTNPPLIDAAASAVSAAASNPPIAPAVFNSAVSDLIFVSWGQQDIGQNFHTIAPLTDLSGVTSNSFRTHTGYILSGGAGTVGPYPAFDDATLPWSALTTTLKAGNPGVAPAQTLSNPIAVPGAVGPGLFTMAFSVNPLGISGVTRQLPPATDFDWVREAPLAIVTPNNSFNLVGISPENAAWASMTWVAVK